MPNSTEVLSLYRQIIKHAKVFPSKNRLRILKEIRAEFKDNKSLTDQSKILIEWDKATKGLSQLTMYTSLNRSASSWVVELDKNPMPRPASK
jgi:hypothetical protein